MAIQTVNGPISLDDLGPTMVHEHIFIQFDEKWRQKSMEFAGEELGKLARLGGKTIVDVMPAPARKMDWYKEIAAKVNLNIILSTGYYLERHPSLVPSQALERSCDEMYEIMLREILEGIDGSGIRAGVIKVAGDLPQLTSWEIKVMRAAARAQKETGVPICTHACAGAMAQFNTLTAAGADPERIYLSHIEAEFGWEGRTLREEARHLEDIARRGGSLFFNNFEFQFDTPHEDMMYLMHYLLDRGLGNRILYGMDTNFYFDEQGNAWLEAQRQHPETAVRVYSYTLTGAQDLMRRWGFTDADFHQFLVENPRSLFSTARV